MSLYEELTKRLDNLKKSAQEYSIFVNSIEGKKQMKESEVSGLESKIEKLKIEYVAAENRANLILRQANDESQAKTLEAKKLLEEAQAIKNKAADDIRTSQKTMNEAQALMVQAAQKQKEADNMYAQYQERKRKLEEAIR